jgi:tRNA threonylcarbamoyladenosine biosynthesis protein TsaE
MLISKSTKETEEFAKKIAKKSKNIRVFYLYGDLGSGKTIFTKAFVEELGVEKFHVKSPTYTYIREYKLKDQSIYHIDLYRIEELDELLFQEIEELIENPNNILIIEWADKLAEKLDGESLSIKFEYLSENERAISLQQS